MAIKRVLDHARDPGPLRFASPLGLQPHLVVPGAWITEGNRVEKGWFSSSFRQETPCVVA
ncbi:MAG: hypothetical protein WC138_07465 [Methanoculleus sp.]